MKDDEADRIQKIIEENKKYMPDIDTSKFKTEQGLMIAINCRRAAELAIKARQEQLNLFAELDEIMQRQSTLINQFRT